MNSITTIIAKAKESNNGRLNSLALTEGEKRMAEKAVERSLMTMHHGHFPGFGMVKLYELAAA